MTAISQALEDLKRYNCLTEFKDVRLDMKDIIKPPTIDKIAKIGISENLWTFHPKPIYSINVEHSDSVKKFL